jgi:L,D-transpeptidase YcbB
MTISRAVTRAILLSSLLMILPLRAQSVAPPPANAPAMIQWDKANAQALLNSINAAGADGLDPADYAPQKLAQAIQGGDAAMLDTVATDIFGAFAHDLIEGHVAQSDRIAWFIKGPVTSAIGVVNYMNQALTTRQVPEALAALVPTHPQYLALKAALAKVPPQDRALREQIRVNLERWRWMPRDLGADHIFVNVAGFNAAVFSNNKAIAIHRVIVGKTKTPTPQFSTLATGVILNPYWEVPQSIIAEGIGKLVRTNPAAARAKGYVGDGSRVRQSPGPGNALGRMKLVMPNPYTIYLHDTPSKTLFERDVRAMSHGCIRTDKALAFVATLLKPVPGWDQAAIDRAVASLKTIKVDFGKPLPVYISYFTAVANDDGTVTRYPDIYGRDELVTSALTNRERLDEIGAVLPKIESECSAQRG